MRVLSLFGGPHQKGNTASLLERFLEGARSAGHEITRIDVKTLEIKPVWAARNRMPRA